ncbi:hypothetical protein AALA56_05420 [Streptococcus hyointestinalis]|uniref:hypothetical protein n=1 Tax=Streptococcus hyointestinalis TaxID=1337 RepID=UPI003518A90A
MSDITLRKEAADYKRLGLKPDQIEMWEDGRRDQAVKGHWEWWYFDALLDDGSQLVLQFFPKEPSKKSVEDSPSYRMTLTLPDGRVLKKNVEYDAKDCYFGKDKADLRFGQSLFTGDLQTYRIKADVNDSKEQIGADITLASQSKPY